MKKIELLTMLREEKEKVVLKLSDVSKDYIDGYFNDFKNPRILETDFDDYFGEYADFRTPFYTYDLLKFFEENETACYNYIIDHMEDLKDVIQNYGDVDGLKIEAAKQVYYNDIISTLQYEKECIKNYIIINYLIYKVNELENDFIINDFDIDYYTLQNIDNLDELNINF